MSLRTVQHSINEDLDLEGAARVRAELALQIAEPETVLVLDLAGCDFVDSIGVGLLLATRATLRNGGGTLRIVNLSPAVARTLHLAGVDDILRDGT